MECRNPECRATLPDYRKVCLRCGTEQHVETLPPVARTDDAQTSHAAASAVTNSGVRVSIMSRIREVLQAQPGLTSGEIADRLPDLDYPQVWRRVSDLKNRGEIQALGEREWHGNRQQVWWPVVAEPEQRPLL
jgi:hypothetical protein